MPPDEKPAQPRSGDGDSAGHPHLSWAELDALLREILHEVMHRDFPQPEPGDDGAGP